MMNKVKQNRRTEKINETKQSIFDTSKGAATERTAAETLQPNWSQPVAKH
jgi:hypothetical protein